jgi:hypothetical protein
MFFKAKFYSIEIDPQKTSLDQTLHIMTDFIKMHKDKKYAIYKSCCGELAFL